MVVIFLGIMSLRNLKHFIKLQRRLLATKAFEFLKVLKLPASLTSRRVVLSQSATF